ncbi:MAG: MogA/MoaB family molybdenum cofactor biosynthesis protein [Chloroflexota bacterium]
MRIGILTVSDRASRGEYQDLSGPLIASMIQRLTSWHVARQAIVADEMGDIASHLLEWSDSGLNLIFTTGGTGFSPRDVTPEATLRVIEREAPGIAEALRYESMKITRHAMLSRARAGIRGQTLIINLPGSQKAVKESLDILLPVLPHALDLLVGHGGAENEHRAV